MATTSNNKLTRNLGWFAFRGSEADIKRAEEIIRSIVGDTAAEAGGLEVARRPGAFELSYHHWNCRINEKQLTDLMRELPELKLNGVAEGRGDHEVVYSRAGTWEWVNISFYQPYREGDLPYYKWWDKDDFFELADNPDGSLCIAGYYRWDKEVEIPEQIDGKPVTSIGDKAFARNTHIRKVVVPDFITSMGKGVFGGCSNLVVHTANPVVTKALAKTKVSVVSGNESEADLEAKANYAYSKVDGGIEITKYRGDALEVEIPAAIEGQPVVSIGEGAFDSGYKNPLEITKVVIPASVVLIKDRAFFCPNLTNLEFAAGSKIEAIGECSFSGCHIGDLILPEGLREIGEKAFYGCDSLKSVRIPSTVESIGSEAFGGLGIDAWPSAIEDHETFCLEGIDVDSANTCYASIEGALFSKDATLLIRVPVLATGTYVVPEGVTEIAAHAFEGSHVERVELPSSIRVFGDEAFCYCSNLVELVFAEGAALEKVGEDAFEYCDHLKEFKLPESTLETAEMAFAKCKNLGFESFDIPASVEALVRWSDKGFSFYDFKRLRKVGAAPGSRLCKIAKETFHGCDSLEMIDLSNAEQLVTVDAGAFNITDFGIWSLRYVKLPASVTTFEKWFGDDMLAHTEKRGVDFFAPGIPLSAIKATSYKLHAAAGFVRGMGEGGAASSEVVESYRKYIKGRVEEILYKVDFDAGALAWMIEGKLIARRDVETFAQVATKRGLVEQAAMLLEYGEANSVKGAGGLELGGLELESKPPTITELKKVWGFKKTGEDACEIVSWKGHSSVAEVPERVGKMRVVSIGSEAFSPIASRAKNGAARRDLLEHVVVPEGVQAMGHEAFAKCGALRTVDLPASLQSLGWNTFWGTRLTLLTVRSNTSLLIDMYDGLHVDELRIAGPINLMDDFRFERDSKIGKVAFHVSMPQEQRDEVKEKLSRLNCAGSIMYGEWE